MALNMSNFAPMLKTLYTKEKIQNLNYKEQPFYAMMAKDEGFFGDSKPIPLIFGNPQGRSANFAKAQAGKTNTKSTKFTITRARDYQLISIDNETIDASKNDAGAFASARKVEIDGAFMNIGSTLAYDIWGTGSGSRGQVSASQTLSATTVTLANADDIVNIEVDMKLVASATDGGGSVRSGAAYVISVDRVGGTFQVSSSLGGAATALSTCISAIAVSDYLFVDGDYDSKVKGVSAWLPYGGPSSTPFFGVDRTQDSVRLGGYSADLSSYTVQEALIEAVKVMKRQGAATDKIWVSDTRMGDLVKELGSKVYYVDQKVGNIGFTGLKVQAGDRVVDVFADRNIKTDRMFALQMNTWKLETLGQAPRILNMDSLEALREATADAIEVRIGYYGQVSCNAPGYNGHFKI